MLIYIYYKEYQNIQIIMLLQFERTAVIAHQFANLTKRITKFCNYKT